MYVILFSEKDVNLKTKKHPLKKWLIKKGIPQTQFASLCNIRREYLSLFLNYKTPNPPGVALCVLIEKLTGAEVTRWELRNDKMAMHHWGDLPEMPLAPKGNNEC